MKWRRISQIIQALCFSSYCASAWASQPKCATPLSGEISADQIRSLQEKNRNLNSEYVLGCLPKEIRRNFTVVYKSGSLNASCIDSRHPRIILFTEDASTAVAFPVGPNLPSRCQSIEIMRASKDGTFDFQEVPLTEKAKKTSLAHGGNQSCVACHGADLRPIMAQYPVWPGFLGSKDDGIPKDAKEAKILSDLKSYLKSRGLYHFLVWPHEKDPDGARSPYQSDYIKGSDHSLRPNLKLTDRLWYWNSIRIARLFRNSPQYDRLKNFLFAQLAQCSLSKDLMEKVKSSASDAHGFVQFEPGAKAFNHEKLYAAFGFKPMDFSMERKPDRFDYNFGQGIENSDVLGPTVLRALLSFEPMFKDLVKSFSKQTGDGDYAFANDKLSYRYDWTDPFVSREAVKSFCETIQNNISAQLSRSLDIKNQADCRDGGAKTMSGAEMRSITQIGDVIRASGLNVFRQHCGGCHLGTDPPGGAIPFDNLALFKKKLRDTNFYSKITTRLQSTGNDGMPPLEKDAQEKAKSAVLQVKKDLLQYLRDLNGQQ